MRLQLLLVPLLAIITNAYNLPLTCAPNNATMTTPTYNLTGAIFTVCSQISMHAAPSAIYNTLLDFPRYPAWNTFVYAVDLPSGVSSPKDVYVGMSMTFYTTGLVPGVNTTSTEKVTYLQKHAKTPFVGWRSDIEATQETMQAEHISVLVDEGRGKTRYVSWETYYGVGSVALLVLRGNLQTEFEKQGVDLKKRVER